MGERTESYYSKCMKIPQLRYALSIAESSLYGINPKPLQMSNIEAVAKSLYENHVKT